MADRVKERECIDDWNTKTKEGVEIQGKAKRLH
jgi:hypothetical protein